MSNSELIKIQPYARLLTMLSEQLIKNEVVALSEIVKNSYDADSEWVKISFENFTKSYKAQKNSRIVIEDCGMGMTADVLKNDFINPASAYKKFKKERGETSPKGRILQGEKGIGRFSLFKLGKRIKQLLAESIIFKELDYIFVNNTPFIKKFMYRIPFINTVFTVNYAPFFIRIVQK